MASPTTTILLLLTIITIGLFAVTTTARPCKTIFFITSSTTTTFYPNPTLTNSQNPNSHRLTFFITEIHQFHRPTIFSDQSSNDAVSSKSYFPKSSSDDNNDGENKIDVMSVVGSLLFGVGCGAVTAAVLYLIWSLCSDDHDKIDDCEDSDVSDDDVEGDVSRNGYVAVANGAKEVPPTADEVEAMKAMK